MSRQTGKKGGGGGGNFFRRMLPGGDGSFTEKASGNTAVNPEYQKANQEADDLNNTYETNEYKPALTGVNPYVDTRGFWGRFTGQPTMANQLNLNYQAQGITNQQNLGYNQALAGINRDSAVLQQKQINDVNLPFNQKVADMNTAALAKQGFNEAFTKNTGLLYDQAPITVRDSYNNLAPARLTQVESDINSKRAKNIEDIERAKTNTDIITTTRPFTIDAAQNNALTSQLVSGAERSAAASREGIDATRSGWVATQKLPNANLFQKSLVTVPRDTFVGQVNPANPNMGNVTGWNGQHYGTEASKRWGVVDENGNKSWVNRPDIQGINYSGETTTVNDYIEKPMSPVSYLDGRPLRAKAPMLDINPISGSITGPSYSPQGQQPNVSRGITNRATTLSAPNFTPALTNGNPSLNYTGQLPAGITQEQFNKMLELIRQQRQIGY